MTMILLVEDEASLRDIVASVLEDEGFEVFPAVDGQDALNLLANQRPNLIITDAMMPRMDGRELVGVIRSSSEWSSIPVVMVSAVVMPGVDILGIDAFISKPFDFDLLLRTIRDILDGPERSPFSI